VKPMTRTEPLEHGAYVMPDIEGSKRLDWLKRQMEQALGDVENVTNTAADEDRDLTEAEERTCEARRSRITDLEKDLKVEADLVQRSASYQGLVAHIGPPAEPALRGQLVERQAKPDAPVYETPGAYLVDYLTRSEDPDAKARFGRYLERANQTTAQNPGLLPVPILGPVFTEQVNRRPAMEASTLRPLPGSGKTFQRPKISQYTLAGPQTAEKTALPSQPLLIDPITVTKQTYGGFVNLSWQDRDWTDPAIMDLLVSDLAASYANATDSAFCTYFVGSVTQTQALATPDSEGLLGAIFAASGTIAGQVNSMPDTIWVAPNVWGALGSMVDTTGRQMFPTVNPVNAIGTMTPTSFVGSVAGMKLVVDKNLAAGTAIIGDSRYVEVYETVGGQVSAIEPSILGTTVAFYGYIAWLTVEPKAFVKLTGVPVLPLSSNGNGGTPASTHSSTHKAAK
jgi:HK97 family phage major capsid protein